MDAAAMEYFVPRAASSAASLLLKLAADAPAASYCHYLGTLSVIMFFVFVYNLLEFHVVGDVLRRRRGDRVTTSYAVLPAGVLLVALLVALAVEEADAARPHAHLHIRCFYCSFDADDDKKRPICIALAIFITVIILLLIIWCIRKIMRRSAPTQLSAAGVP